MPRSFGTFCFAATAQADPKAKQKEPNRQRFVQLRSKLSM